MVGRAAIVVVVLWMLAGRGYSQGQEKPAAGAMTSAQVKTTMVKAYKLIKAKRNVEAIAAFNSVLKSDPDNHTALVELGYLNAGLRRWKPAVEFLKRASDQDPSNLRLHMDVGYAYQAVRNYEEAAKEFELVSKQPGEFQAQAEQALKVLKETEENARLASNAKQGRLLDQGYAALAGGNRALARQKFTMVLGNDPQNRAALKQLGFINLEEGKLRAAKESFEAARNLDSSDYFVSLQLGYIYDRLKDKEKAKEAFNATLASTDPKIHDAAQQALRSAGGEVSLAAPAQQEETQTTQQ